MVAHDDAPGPDADGPDGPTVAIDAADLATASERYPGAFRGARVSDATLYEAISRLAAGLAERYGDPSYAFGLGYHAPTEGQVEVAASRALLYGTWGAVNEYRAFFDPAPLPRAVVGHGRTGWPCVFALDGRGARVSSFGLGYASWAEWLADEDGVEVAVGAVGEALRFADDVL